MTKAEEKSIYISAIENKTAIVKKPFPLRTLLAVLFLGAAAILLCVLFPAMSGGSYGELTPNRYLTAPTVGTPADIDAEGDYDINGVTVNGAIRNLFIAAGVLKEADSFSAVCEGSTVAHSMVGDLVQDIRSERTAVGDSAYKQSVSYGVKKLAEQRYVRGGNYNDCLIRDKSKISSITDIEWSDKATNIGMDGFMDRYGYIPNEMTAYYLNENSVLTGDLVSYENGLYTYTYDLDIIKAPGAEAEVETERGAVTKKYGLVKEMAYSAGTDDEHLPIFHEARLTVTMDENWVVKQCVTYANYDVVIMGGQTCDENMTEVFTQVGGIKQLPQYEFFKDYFGQSEEVGDKTYDATDLLLEMFENYIMGDPLDAEIKLSAPVSALDGLSASLHLNLDIENTENITANAQIPLGGKNLDIYYGDGSVLFAYGDFKGRLSIDEVIGLIGRLSGETAVATDTDKPADGGFTLDSLLDGATVETTDTDCKVSLALDVGGLLGLDTNLAVDADLFGKKNADGKYKFDSAVATVGEYTVTAKSSEAYEWRELNAEECPDILGLLDIIKDNKISFALNANDITANVQIDLENKTAAVVFGDLIVNYENDTVYAEYNDVRVKLNVNDIERIYAQLSPILEKYGITEKITEIIGGLSDTELDLSAILSSIVISSDGDSASLSCGLMGADICVSLTNNNNSWNLECISGAYDGFTFSVNPTEAFVPAEIGGDYIDIATLIDDYSGVIYELLNADGYEFDADLNIVIDGKAVNINATINYNDGLSVNGYLTYEGLKAVRFDVIYKNGILYMTVDGVDIAVNIGAKDEVSETSRQTTDFETVLGMLKGYNSSLDCVIDEIVRVANIGMTGDIDFAALLGSLTYDDGSLNVTVDGGQFDVPDLTLSVSGGDRIGVVIDDYTFGGITFGLNASVSPSTVPVTVPDRDYITYLQIEIDELNVIYAKLDIPNGKYSFKMDNLYGEYSGSTIYIAYKGDSGNDVLLRGDIDEMTEIITRLDGIVKDAQSRYAIGLMTEIVDGLEDAEADDILGDFIRSIELITGEGDTLSATFGIFGFNGCLNISCGEDPTFEIVLPFLGKNITAMVSENAETVEYYDFASKSLSDFVDVTEIFNGYMDEIEKLVSTNSWHFGITSEIVYNDTKLYLAEGSAIDLLYYTNEKYDLKVTLNLNKWDENTNAYIDAYHVIAAYVGNRIYVDYWDTSNNSTVNADNHLKVTLSRQAIEDCTDQIPELLRVVPQLDELIKSIMGAMKDASANMELVKYSTIIRDASFDDSELYLVLNGGAILPALGDIDIMVTKGENGGIDLTIGTATYIERDKDGKVTTNVAIVGFTAKTSALSEEDGIAAIGVWSTDGYMNFDSIKELLTAFNHTADDRSFRIHGTVHAKLVVSVDIDIDIAVDIDDEGYAYVAARMYRHKIGLLEFKGAAFNDYGGYSYITYNDKTKTLRIVRNSYQYYFPSIKLNTEAGHDPEYDTGELTVAQFKEHAIDYILEMVNFKSWINDQITGAINGESTTVYGIEDIIKDYTYSDGAFNIVADLTPMDSNLGVATVAIHHDENYELTYLSAEMGLLKNWCTITIDRLELVHPTYGDATNYVTNPDYLLW